jgi:hypothetical protein
LSEISTRYNTRRSVIQEQTVSGAKSILLTEDNLSNYVDYATIQQIRPKNFVQQQQQRRFSSSVYESPDLIQVKLTVLAACSAF